MEKEVKIALGSMTIITAISTALLTYNWGYITGESHAREHSLVKSPIEYGITKSFFAERLETEPPEYYTPDELGIVLIKSGHFEYYGIYIAREHKEKALIWMKDGEFEPNAVKYGDEFYEIHFLWVTPGLGENVNLLPIQIGTTLGIGWTATALIFRGIRRKAE